uniref:NADH dehydrogenase [ubiquinone] 1 beta subcomplex subunit 10 n=1 Tax=Phallusia mammillata TaxID=59560 RepID=A0A6F9DM41_9ASCI|nr:NADH dehydrogenase [ubiquinone] 1 beta subcomplex subunit 10-like [Phallusia mammillata]
MGNKLASAAAPLKDIPGVKGPIEDPIEREQNRVFREVEVVVPELEFKSKLNPVPLVYSWFYYSFKIPQQFVNKLFDTISVQKPRRYFHRKLPRVPEIWECALDDMVCVYEAEKQFDRDRKVDQEVLRILNKRVQACQALNGENSNIYCAEVKELERQTENAWRIKYGDIGTTISARKVLNKQKNRFIETRYLASKNKRTETEDEP